MREEEQRGEKKRAARGDCLLLLFKHSAEKFALYGTMAVNILWKVSGDAQRATVIFLLRKSHFVAVSPPAGLSKVRTVLWSLVCPRFNIELEKGMIELKPHLCRLQQQQNKLKTFMAKCNKNWDSFHQFIVFLLLPSV